MSEMSDVRKGMNLGAEDYLTKPFKSKGILLSVIDIQLKKADEREEHADGFQNFRSEKIINSLRDQLNSNEVKWRDSLKSAGKIQSAILPKESEMTKIFPDSFNYYRPKYNVSGDFYWAQNLEDLKLVAVADCTGHGIPASLLTICCYNGLNVGSQAFWIKRTGRDSKESQ